MRIAIIGASGFIGRHLYELFASHPDTTIVVWNRHFHGDFLSRENREKFLDLNHLDLIYQLAWTSIEDDNYRQNLENTFFAEATIDFVESCLRRNLRIVVIGTQVNEEVSSSDRYHSAKAYLWDCISQFPPNLIFYIRPTYVFSLQELRPHLFKSFLGWINEGKKPEDFLLRSPRKLIDLIHVKDVAECLFRIYTHPSLGINVTVASGLSLSVENIIEFLNKRIVESDVLSPLSEYERTKFSSSENFVLLNRNTLSFFGLSDNIS